jgi:hypothetical protein
MHLRNILIVLTLATSTGLMAQTPAKQVTEQQQTWLGYLNQTRLTSKFGTWTDLHLRRTGHFLDRWSIGIARAGLTYYVTDRVRLTAGYAYIHHYPAAGNQTAWPEHRPWQQIQWFNAYKGFGTMQYLRFEQRYRRRVANDQLEDGYNFNYRLRYNFLLTVPLKGKQMAPGIPFLVLNDEIHINMGKQILYNYFDQNRAFLGIGYPFTSHLNAHLGYMNLFQQLPAGNRFNNTHAIRLFVFHNLDFRQKED